MYLVRLLVLSCALILPLREAAASDDWTTQQKALAVAALAAHVGDWAQTRTIAANPDRWYESNPLLGRHPSLGAVNRHFVVGAALMLGAAHLMPRWRNAILSSWLVVEVGFVAHNARLGIGMKF